jgi:hypothetical protein
MGFDTTPKATIFVLTEQYMAAGHLNKYALLLTRAALEKSVSMHWDQWMKKGFLLYANRGQPVSTGGHIGAIQPEGLPPAMDYEEWN